jgi:hypothetical protein
MVTVSGLGLPPLTITFEYSNEDMRFQKRESAPLSMECSKKRIVLLPHNNSTVF